MSKLINVHIFNDLLDKFFDFLDNDFPYFRADLVLIKTTRNFIRKGNPRLIVTQFMEYIKPYSKQIYECDEDYFVNFESNCNLQHLSQDNFLLGKKIRDIWVEKNTSQRQKATIFYYFQKLLEIGEKCL
jgi:hypothetical protein